MLEFYWEHRDDSSAELTRAVMTNEWMWGQDLTQVPGFEKSAEGFLKLIRTEGPAKLMENLAR